MKWKKWTDAPDLVEKLKISIRDLNFDFQELELKFSKNGLIKLEDGLIYIKLGEIDFVHLPISGIFRLNTVFLNNQLSFAMRFVIKNVDIVRQVKSKYCDYYDVRVENFNKLYFDLDN